jgi:RNA polymerase sigma-70 factor (ECF subfamily)
MNLQDRATFSRVYDEHHRGVYGAAYRILGNAAQAQDVAQDVFLRVWRKPRSSTPSAASSAPTCGSWPAPGRSDLWREGQAAGRASDRLKLVVAQDEPRTDERPATMAEREDDRRIIREALRELPDAQREAVVLAYWGGLTGRPDRPALRRAARDGQEPHPPRPGQAARGVRGRPRLRRGRHRRGGDRRRRRRRPRA